MSKKQIYSTNDVAPRLDGRVILKVGMSLVRTSQAIWEKDSQTRSCKVFEKVASTYKYPEQGTITGLPPKREKENHGLKSDFSWDVLIAWRVYNI